MASGTLKTEWGNYTKKYALVVDWTSTANNAANTSTVKLVIKLYCPYAAEITRRYSNKATINGVTYEYDSPAVNSSGGTYTTLATITSGDIQHNSDGSKSIAISVVFRFNAYLSGNHFGNQTVSANIALDKIPRAATITAAPNFNDEQNPTITYKNSAGNAVTSLMACISLDGSKDDVAYRNISKTGTSYTFNLTEAERNVLRKATTGKNRTVRFFIQTVIGDKIYRNNLTKTFTIVNAAPIVNPVIYDVDENIVALTGNKNITMLKYSNIYYDGNISAQKGATIKSIKVTDGKTTKTTATGTFSNIDRYYLNFVVTDSRGFTTHKNVTQKTFHYTKLTSNISGELSTGGIMNINIKGNYFNSTFGAVNNTITLEYRIKENGGSWSAWEVITPTLGAYGTEHTYNAQLVKEGYYYRNSYTLQARATDKIMTVTTPEYQLISYPVFDWSKDDFQFNVPVRLQNGTPLQGQSGTGDNINLAYITTNTRNLQIGGGAYPPENIFINTADNAGTVSINGKSYGVNRVLWSGSYYMTEGQTATLSEKVSEQVSGIILVFSRYDIANSDAMNEHFSCHFVPKQLVALQDGKGSVFTMNTVSYSFSGSKYLYISDGEIRGNTNNDAVGTGDNGIAFNNNRFVLRYVIGV